jgi:RHS repeat-associated protein
VREHRARRDDDRRDRHYGGLVDITGTTSPVISRNIPGPGGVVASLRGTGGTWVFGFGEQRGFRFSFDENGNLLQKIGYEPFGEATTDTATPGTTTYTSDQWNGGDDLAAFNLVHVGARIYDPVVGRFMSRDALTDTSTSTHANPYSFALNDPINRSDPSGLDPCDDGASCNNGPVYDGPGFTWGLGASNGGGYPAGPSTDALSTGGIDVSKPTVNAARPPNFTSIALQAQARDNAERDQYWWGTRIIWGGFDELTNSLNGAERTIEATNPALRLARQALDNAGLELPTEHFAQMTHAPQSVSSTTTYGIGRLLTILASLALPALPSGAGGGGGTGAGGVADALAVEGSSKVAWITPGSLPPVKRALCLIR